MKPVLVVNLKATYSAGRHPESCACSSWRVAAARVPDIDTVVGVYEGMVVAVSRGCSLVPSTPEVVGDDWDEGCLGRYYVLGGEVFTDRDVSVWSLTVAGTFVECTGGVISHARGRQDPDGKCAVEVSRIGNLLGVRFNRYF